MRKIKIIEVIADSSLSGAPMHLLTLIKNLDKSNFSIVLICPSGWLAREAKKNGIKTINIPLKGFADYNSILKLRTVIELINPEVIHFHGVRAGWLGVLAAGRYKRRLIYTEHLYTRNYHLDNQVREWVQLRGLSYILKNVRIILAPSHAVKKFLVKKFKIKKNKIIVVYNGLEDLSRGARRREISGGLSPTARDDPRVGFIGSLNIQKGVDNLIKAFAIINKFYPDFRLEIIGSGPLKENLVKMAQKKNRNIYFLGAKKNFWQYLSHWKIVVMPSRSESFGQTALAAAILSKPVVATNVGGLPEVVLDRKTGLLVRADNPKILARAIICLLKDPQKAKRMGEQGRIRYERLFTARIMAAKIENIYLKFNNVL